TGREGLAILRLLERSDGLERKPLGAHVTRTPSGPRTRTVTRARQRGRIPLALLAGAGLLVAMLGFLPVSAVRAQDTEEGEGGKPAKEIDLSSESAADLLDAGTAEAATGEYADAIRDLSAAAEKDPGSAAARLALG